MQFLAAMKKIFSLLFFGIALLFFLGKGDFVFAQNVQSDVNACCKLHKTFKFEGIEFKKGYIVGEQWTQDKPSYCFMDGETKELKADYIEVLKSSTLPSGPGSLGYYKKWGMVCLINVIYRIADWAFYLMFVFAVCLLTATGFKLMWHRGDPEKTKKTLKMVWYTIVALILALLAKIGPSAWVMILGG